MRVRRVAHVATGIVGDHHDTELTHRRRAADALAGRMIWQ
jgi:hypothetical protein